MNTCSLWNTSFEFVLEGSNCITLFVCHQQATGSSFMGDFRGVQKQHENICTAGLHFQEIELCGDVLHDSLGFFHLIIFHVFFIVCLFVAISVLSRLLRGQLPGGVQLRTVRDL